ncbi:MFS transporter [Amycolatopsis vastitatis]|uniref:MFS transporter n=1 Tax=Amycolatopsis vastitatis TaxID=1905142 RepID=A0A229TB59_9PSEU|nr:MFS transporter [Amycolatopsis vastitatis]OXM68495.1 MFS transporter [Amycolatopsis vastitatis]
MPIDSEITRYRDVLALPAALRTFIPALVGRSAYALLPLSLLFAVHDLAGSFTAAGTALAGYGFAGILLPVKAGLIDRHSQARTLPVLAVCAAVPMAVIAVVSPANAALLVVLATSAGIAAPPLGPAMRSSWRSLTRGTPLKRRAYALDSTCEETLYLGGPLVAGVLLVVWSPRAALLLVVVLLLLGALGMATAPPARCRVHETSPAGPWTLSRGPIGAPGLRLVVAAILVTALGLSMTYTCLAATASGQGRPAVAGFVEAAIGLGSVVGGLVWGRLEIAASRSTQLARLIAFLGVGMAFASMTTSLIVIGISLAIAGLAIAPLFVVSYVAADDLAPENQGTEAGSWVNTANNLGSALGASAAGLIVDNARAQWGFLAGAVALLLTVAVVRLSRKSLDTTPAAQ